MVNIIFHIRTRKCTKLFLRKIFCACANSVCLGWVLLVRLTSKAKSNVKKS